MLRRIILLLIFGGCVFPSGAQDFPSLLFSHITIREGLSNNNVTAFCEDQFGFMWVGTTNGLNRFDGYRFRHYYHSNRDSNSLVNNAVQTLFCDTHNRIWVGTEDGVSCFNPANNRFVNYNNRFKAPYRLQNNSSVRIYEDAGGTIWFSNQSGYIFHVLPDLSLQASKLNVPAFNFMGFPTEGYYDIARDRQGREWAYSANRLYALNTSTKQAEKTFYSADLPLFKILQLYQTTDGHYFMASWGKGLWQFDPANGKYQPLQGLNNMIVTSLSQWSYAGKTWLAALEANYGLYLLDPATGNLKHYGVIQGDPSSLKGTLFNSFYVDKRGTLWLATNNGISRTNNGQSFMDLVPVSGKGEVNFDNSVNGAVYAYCENGNEQWISKRFLSTLLFDSTGKILHNYYSLSRMREQRPTAADGFAYYFYPFQGALYISTDSGLVKINRERNSARSFFPVQAPGYTSFRTIVPFNDSEIFIRSFDKGIYRFDIREDKFTGFYSNNTNCRECLPFHINYLFRSRSGRIYVTTSAAGKGLFEYSRAADRFLPLRPLNDSVYHMQASDLFGMDEDKEGRLWITSSSGLFVYDPVSNRVVEEHNENDQIGGLSRICFDRYGNVWANGTGGIWCYRTDRKQWIGFGGQDDLPGGDFGGVILQKKNGDILSGMEGAYALFHPQYLKNAGATISAVITEASTAAGNDYFEPVPLKNKKLVLSPGDNFFTADFAVLDYEQPFTTRYYYRLEPVSSVYKENTDGHLNFTGLSPGHYTLYVKGGDKAGNLYSGEDRLEIIVRPFWYQTGLFRLFASIMLATGVFVFVRRRIRQVRKEAALRQQIAETEMQALRAQMNPHFIFNSLNSIENFIMLNEKRLASDYLNKFSRLIRSILDSSRNELVPLSKDLEALQLYVELEQLRFDHKFSYTCEAAPELIQGDYRVPSLLIQPYVENAIVHGIAHSERNDLSLIIKITTEGELLRFTITDNGVGRKQAAAYNRINKPGHKSVGLQITAGRIAYFNRGSGISDAVLFTDLYDEGNQPAGTRVDVLIKAI